ncbi:lipoyl(octanoyl) transferase [Kribbella orskensis]|uniref:Octanoyltransferase n=1 Tax=Kribbella orskensis TaxID=2512216 RepID=A0ABY2BLJ9_9ACTN|nr:MULTISPECIES: lipoyl(octanoyl) transferase LipB [Kribbella]TCN39250.1 lipoyl(octanoyl) transferase [Kribbella sp. VKM Ac-2500]TCO21897.1 lipoyl(octanoyl) transferase [Kribbella orskensis]
MRRVDLGEVDYEVAGKDMKTWVEERIAGEAEDRLFLLSHPPVITYGPRTSLDDLPAETAAIPTVAVDRGGFATYHGPGQLVGYLVIDLKQRGPVDIVRWVENGLIDALGSLGFPLIRRDTPKGASSLVGVWTEDRRKLCSIGMRIRRGVTSHGFSINLDPDMNVFHTFTTCGLHDVTMVSLAELAAELDVPVPTDAVLRDAVAGALGAS